jgi:uncharacterized membrane protein YdjX (TVP38/TMEM64 family)
MRDKGNLKPIIGIILIITAFIVVSYIVQRNLDFFEGYIEDDFLGMLIYTLIIVVSIILAPINEVVLIPLATALWGWFAAALLTLLGWMIGSSIAFILAREYGVLLVRKLFPMKKIYQYQEFIAKENTFLGIILLRVIIPFDVVSYAIGIFTRIRFVPYFFATLIGFLPLAFVLAYIGTLPVYMQVLGFIIFLLIVAIEYFSIKRYQTSKTRIALLNIKDHQIKKAKMAILSIKRYRDNRAKIARKRKQPSLK